MFKLTIPPDYFEQCVYPEVSKTNTEKLLYRKLLQRLFFYNISKSDEEDIFEGTTTIHVIQKLFRKT